MSNFSKWKLWETYYDDDEILAIEDESENVVCEFCVDCLTGDEYASLKVKAQQIVDQHNALPDIVELLALSRDICANPAFCGLMDALSDKCEALLTKANSWDKPDPAS